MSLFGQFLKVSREAAAMSQASLAVAAGMSQGKVSKLERGRIKPGWSDLAAFEAALGMSPETAARMMVLAERTAA